MASKKEENEMTQDVRSRIIEGASRMFFSRGIKCVRMDDIANELGVSKRTIYEQFSDKELLLKTCIKHTHRHIADKVLTYLRSNSRNTLDVIFTMYETYFAMLKAVNRQFFIDLRKMPHITQVQEKREQHNKHMFILLVRKGISEGLFRKDINFDVLIYILQQDLQLITYEKKFENYSSDELGRAFILFYLRGIATPKGQQIIEEFIEKRKKGKKE